MSNVNDNNLDDLLRRAAEKYPLRTDSSDFGKLVADLERDPSLILPPVDKEDRRRRRRFFWLFLLLPLAGGAYFAWHGTGQGAVASDQGKTVKVEKGVGDEKNKVGNDKGSEGGKGENGKENVVGGKEDSGEKGTGEGKSKVGNGRDGVVDRGKGDNGIERTTAGGQVNGNDRNVVRNENTVQHEKRRTGNKGRVVGSRGQVAGNDAQIAGDERNVAGSEKNIAGNDGEVDGNEGRVAANDRSKEQVGGAEGTAAASEKRKVDRKISLAATRGDVNVNFPVKAAQQKNKIKVQKPKPSFYVGIVGSPDLSMVKFQSVKHTGYNFGLLLGYSFNSRWAIETGLYYDRKKYYTSGEYFSKAKIPQPNNYDIKTVNGYCDMWEIPLNVRYNFSRGDKMNWFATAGFSNYLMSKEVYAFSGYAWGNPWEKTWQYHTPYKYWFSIFNLSVGYEQRLGKIGNLRLEPFVRVPLSGIGTGSLNIMSAGLNIGITRRIW